MPKGTRRKKTASGRVGARKGKQGIAAPLAAAHHGGRRNIGKVAERASDTQLAKRFSCASPSSKGPHLPKIVSNASAPLRCSCNFYTRNLDILVFSYFGFHKKTAPVTLFAIIAAMRAVGCTVAPSLPPVAMPMQLCRSSRRLESHRDKHRDCVLAATRPACALL